MRVSELIDLLHEYDGDSQVKVMWGASVLGVADVERLGSGVVIDVKSESLCS
jgi:hypothetical protein